ncbi:hypothetical protein ACWZEH_26630 [Streptomyces sp. QTS137]
MIYDVFAGLLISSPSGEAEVVRASDGRPPEERRPTAPPVRAGRPPAELLLRRDRVHSS